jgi:hypothetical protein
MIHKNISAVDSARIDHRISIFRGFLNIKSYNDLIDMYEQINKQVQSQKAFKIFRLKRLNDVSQNVSSRFQTVDDIYLNSKLCTLSDHILTTPQLHEFTDAFAEYRGTNIKCLRDFMATLIEFETVLPHTSSKESRLFRTFESSIAAPLAALKEETIKRLDAFPKIGDYRTFGDTIMAFARARELGNTMILGDKLDLITANLELYNAKVAATPKEAEFGVQRGVRKPQVLRFSSNGQLQAIPEEEEPASSTSSREVVGKQTAKLLSKDIDTTEQMHK